jgi:hypothetical protein
MRPLAAALLLAAGACVQASVAAETPPWARTESRAPCAAYDPLRRPFFGDIHVHTAVSVDAYIYGTRLDPRGAYAFARGATVPVPDPSEGQTRTATIDRPLDFAAVTDHAEFFGEVDVCHQPGSPAASHELCTNLELNEGDQDARFLTQISWMFTIGIPPPPPPVAICGIPGVDCGAARVSVWQDMQAAAEEAYDRTDACTFTTFVAYEYTAAPLGRHLHRNVIFRNAEVPPAAASYLETWQGGVPQGVWTAIETECLGAGTSCDAVIIPHNSNLSGGEQWLDPADGAEALRRQRIEPLAEIHQQKGNSECRFDRLAGAGTDTADELCTFEVEPRPSQTPNQPIPPVGEFPRRNLMRNALKDGLAFEDALGANPFRLGFTGSTDTHTGTGGNTAEADWEGGEGANDAGPVQQLGEQLRTNPGGLTGIWAEENSRDALFAALKRRETFATSGGRPTVRFFAGSYPDASCDDPDLVRTGYVAGTPMGGELGAVRGARSPHFVAWATKDPAGVDLERVQIVKGWVDADGTTHERVFDVAGPVGDGPAVDPATCTPTGAGAPELCARWEDPDFDPQQRAFYYARVIERPSCRWSTRVCLAEGVSPFAPDCAAQAAGKDPVFASCCLDETNDAFLSPLVQERAWTSPIWYQPDGVGRTQGTLRFGKKRGKDRLDLRLHLARLPAAFDPATSPLTVTLADDDEIWRAALPAGALRARGRGRFVLRGNGPGGLAAATLARKRDGSAVLRLRTKKLDLASADRGEHMLTLALESGLWRTEVARRWIAGKNRIGTKTP